MHAEKLEDLLVYTKALEGIDAVFTLEQAKTDQRFRSASAALRVDR
jgi:hypothetical protein